MRLKYYIQLIRPPLGLLGSVMVLASYVVASEGHIRSDILIPVIVTPVLMGGALCVLNDVFDVERDRGRADRPIASGHVKRDHAIVFAVILWVAGMTVVGLWAEHILVVAAALMGSVMGFLYDWRTKAYGLSGNITFGIAVSVCGIGGWGGHTDQVFDPRLLLISAMMFCQGVSTTGVRNFLSYERDVRSDYRTLPTTYGIKKAAILVTLIRYLAIALFVLVLVTADLVHILTVTIAIILTVSAIIIYKHLLDSEHVKSAKRAFGISILFNIALYLTIVVAEVSKHHTGW